MLKLIILTILFIIWIWHLFIAMLWIDARQREDLTCTVDLGFLIISVTVTHKGKNIFKDKFTLIVTNLYNL